MGHEIIKIMIELLTLGRRLLHCETIIYIIFILNYIFCDEVTKCRGNTNASFLMCVICKMWL